MSRQQLLLRQELTPPLGIEHEHTIVSSGKPRTLFTTNIVLLNTLLSSSPHLSIER